MPRLLDEAVTNGPHSSNADGAAMTVAFSSEGAESFSARRVNAVVRSLLGGNKTAIRQRWLSTVAAHVTSKRPDIAGALLEILDVTPATNDLLDGLSIGEIGVCYEALLAQMDRDGRKSAGQYFTPDDAAEFMARQSLGFPEGIWLDPCCGVGNLSWHLAGAQRDPGTFVQDNLVLIDRDETALKTAVTLIGARFAPENNGHAVRRLSSRSVRRDFLTKAPLPDHDFAILNPPYAKAQLRADFVTGVTRDLFAYFVERVAKTSRGFVAVTPASYLSAPKFNSLRTVLEQNYQGGQIFVFDNVPDTLFRGYKYGSRNTSRTNFVRAAVTVCSPDAQEWEVTPILRWQIGDREAMFEEARTLLGRRGIGPSDEWVKRAPRTEKIWDELRTWPRKIQDLLAENETSYFLDVATTPRYYISAAFRSLDRGSKVRLNFRNEDDRDLAAIILNSSIPYLWWRTLDGGVTLPRRVLLSVPVPDSAPARIGELVGELRTSEEVNTVVKLNAGRKNENVKHSWDLVDKLNQELLPEDALSGLELIYASSMFPLSRFRKR